MIFAGNISKCLYSLVDHIATGDFKFGCEFDPDNEVASNELYFSSGW